MKSLYDTYVNLNEGILTDIDKTIKDSDDLLEIYDFINNNYNEILQNELTVSKHKINGKYHVSSEAYVIVKNTNMKSLVNDLFVWDTVTAFICNNCKNLKSLEGAPKKVNGTFACNYCDSLTNLIGAPDEVECFYCNNCKNLKSLEGSPKKCINFNCTFCNSLTNLIGAPKYVDIEFKCDYCNNLSSLEGITWKSVHHFSCRGTAIQLTAREIKKIVHSTHTSSDYK
jgi:hypothetical protein